jgi:hypothetical protein
MSKSKQRNWSHYNQRLRNHARVEVFVSRECRNGWNYDGVQRPGGKRLYSAEAIEACLLIREYFGLGLRQTEGFVQSLLELAGVALKAPDYTTLSRRCATLRPCVARPVGAEGLVIAIDSTGLSLYRACHWNRLKHRAGEAAWNARWRKLHIAVDAHSGLVLSAAYSEATQNDCLHLPALLDGVTGPITAVVADMAYDKRRCRTAIHARGAQQLIPPRKDARLSHESDKLRPFAEAMKPRDDAILFFRHNAINGDTSLAKAAWKRHVGYHVRSRVETVFSQIKAHADDRLTNRTEPNRETQAILKCILINKLAAL